MANFVGFKGNTGHIVVLLEKPVKEKDGAILIIALDSSRSSMHKTHTKKGLAALVLEVCGLKLTRPVRLFLFIGLIQRKNQQKSLLRLAGSLQFQIHKDNNRECITSGFKQSRMGTRFIHSLNIWYKNVNIRASEFLRYRFSIGGNLFHWICLFAILWILRYI